MLEPAAIDVFAELIKTAPGNQFLLAISDRFTKLDQSVPLGSKSVTEVAKASMNE